jgi:hypothetical protein
MDVSAGKDWAESCDGRQRSPHPMREALQGNGGIAEGPGLSSDHQIPSSRPTFFQAGERFDKIAQEYSEDKAKGGIYCTPSDICGNLLYSFAAGGSLGWMTRGSMVVRYVCSSYDDLTRTFV